MFLGRFGPFRYCTKLDVKLVELAPLTHKFAKRSFLGSFHKERTRSTPLDPKLIFGAFPIVSLLLESRCQTGRTGAIIA
jgi:hypothetical protein